MSEKFQLPPITANAQKILEQRYFWRDASGKLLERSWEDVVSRVVPYVVNAEDKFKSPSLPAWKVASKFTDMMINRRFVPNTPTLTNAGRDRAQLAACYVLPLEDSMEDIMDTLKSQALVQKSGGGTGFNFGRLRERGAIIKTTGREAAGPLSVIKFMNYMMSEFITQGGIRFGANMAVMPISHPDIEEFITFKHKDNSCPSFNISVGITDDFMEAVENNGTWNLISPHTKQVVKTVSAVYLFNLITDLAWQTGDPGVLFLDAVNNDNPTPHIGEYEACNPCVTGDTLIATENGLQQIKDIVHNKSAKFALGPDGNLEQITNYIDSGTKKTYKVVTDRGYSIRATANHRWPTADGMKETSELVTGDVVSLQPRIEYTNIDSQEFDKGELLGWLIGDGYITNEKSVNKNAGIIVGDPDADYLDHIKSLICQQIGKNANSYRREEHHTTQLISKDLWKWAVNDCGAHPGKAATKTIPECVLHGSQSMQRGFMRGLFSADGHVSPKSVNGTYYVRLTSKSQALIDQVMVLLAQFGIYSKKYDRKRKPKSCFPYTKKNGSTVEYKSDGILWELNISRSSLIEFNNIVGFTQQYKNNKLAVLIGKNLTEDINTDRIASISDDAAEEVFCLTIEPSHRMCANGIVISNCGEQPLLPNESCTLGHNNLLAYFKSGGNPENWEECVDWDTYASDIEFGVRFLDNIVEINHYPLKAIEKMHKHTNRKIGLGVMGFADLLIKLGVPYESEKALEIANKIAKFHRDQADAASCKLGKERGSFGAFNGSPLARTWPAMRNACRTTVAPTGTTSIIAGCSTGIEPVFGLILRRQQAGMTMYEFHPEFGDVVSKLPEDEQRSLFEYYSTRKTVIGSNLPENVQRTFMQSNDVSVNGHIAMQTTWQQWVDSAISKTINMDFSATVDDVKRAYISAWHRKAKGVTVYRDGCRSNQTLTQAGSIEETMAALAASRKKVVPLCPECGAELEIAGGCESCKSCGYGLCKLG